MHVPARNDPFLCPTTATVRPLPSVALLPFVSLLGGWLAAGGGVGVDSAIVGVLGVGVAAGGGVGLARDVFFRLFRGDGGRGRGGPRFAKLKTHTVPEQSQIGAKSAKTVKEQ